MTRQNMTTRERCYGVLVGENKRLFGPSSMGHLSDWPIADAFPTNQHALHKTCPKKRIRKYFDPLNTAAQKKTQNLKIAWDPYQTRAAGTPEKCRCGSSQMPARPESRKNLEPRLKPSQAGRSAVTNETDPCTGGSPHRNYLDDFAMEKDAADLVAVGKKQVDMLCRREGVELDVHPSSCEPHSFTDKSHGPLAPSVHQERQLAERERRTPPYFF